MRLNASKFIVLVIFVEIVALYYSWKFISRFGTTNLNQNVTLSTKVNNKPNARHLGKFVTVVIRGFELQENDLLITIESFINLFPNINILIVCDELPYPPFELIFSNSTLKNVKLVNLSVNLNVPFKENYPLFYIKTKYVLFVTDSIRISNRQSIVAMFNEIIKSEEKIIVSPIGNAKNVQCLKTNLSIKEWTLKYYNYNNLTCDSIVGRHISMVDTEILWKLPNVFIMPFPESLYIQTTAQDIKIMYMKKNVIHDNRLVQKSHHVARRYYQIEQSQQKKMYELFSIKKVVQSNGNVSWFGCNRETPRCFGTVIDNSPSYLHLGKWTPPCCLYNLRTVGRHVFEKLNEFGVRYWLEGESLLGALKFADILPWDYKIDIGINRDDISRCEYLVKAKNKQFADPKNFIWEKATEGEFFRVHFSKINRLYVNIFPFYSKNGTMTKDTWFTNHKNVEFPDNFLHPMSSIEFLGRQVPSPNNIRDFLELKYDKEVIENLSYPEIKRIRWGT